MNISELRVLLDEFNGLPKNINESTYLDLCQYPTRRFEEICSRLLSFYFLPINEHRFSDLFLKSFLQILPNADKLLFSTNKIKIIEEENAEGKRIDLVIVGDNFVIGIENKITADLYNPLDIYRHRLNDYKKDFIIGVVLSIHPIKKESEKKLLIDNKFINVLYSDLFLRIKQNIGFYINQCNNKYLTFLDDFIKTIENMEQNNILNPSLSDFFYENTSKLDELFDLYSEFNSRIKKIQLQNLQSLNEAISIKTSHKWWIWEDWDFGCDMIINDHKIGIETHFKTTNKNPTGEFKIIITTWNLKDWNYFKDSIISKFPNKTYEIEDGRAYLYYDILISPELSVIEDKLFELYNRIKEIN